MTIASTTRPAMPSTTPVLGTVRQAGYLTGREIRALLRQPVYVAFTLVQPMIWLLLFGQLFEKVAELPGFGAGGSYISFMTPGVVIMTVLFASAWTGTGFIEEMQRGTMDRFLVSPVSRGALITGRLANGVLSCVIQSLIVFGVGYAMGARFGGAALGIPITVAAAVVLGLGFGALSCALALLTRQQETLIAVSQFLALPLTFLCSAIMDIRLAPDWLQTVARYNPVDWAVRISRESLAAAPDWSSIGWHALALAAFALVMGWLATRAFATYQRSV